MAQVFVRDYAHLVDAMVICGTGGQFPPADGTAELNGRSREARRADDQETWADTILDLFCGPSFKSDQPDAFAEVCDELWNQLPPGEARWDARISPSSSYWGRAMLPSLLIYASHDRNGTPENAKDLDERLSNSRLVTVAEAGHFVTREAPATVVSEILSFTQEISAH